MGGDGRTRVIRRVPDDRATSFLFFPSFQNGLIISASSIQQILFFSSPQHVFNRMKTRALNQTE